MQHYIDVRLNCRDEPKPVTSYFDDRLIERDLVGILAAVRLEIRLLYPVEVGRSGTIHAKTIRDRYCIRKR